MAEDRNRQTGAGVEFNDDDLELPLADSFVPEDSKYLRDKKRKFLRESEEVYKITASFRDGTPPTFRRDARESTPLAKCIIPDKNYTLIGNNILQRALGSARGILYTLKSLPQNSSQDRRDVLDALIQQEFETLSESINREPQTDLKKFKKVCRLHYEKFNLTLLALLKQNNLLIGIEGKPKAQQKLLLYYANLASLLDPAPIVETITQIKLGDDTLTYTETAIPMTVKTQKQKDAITTAIAGGPKTAGKKATNFYQAMSAPFQAATKAFQDRLTSDETLMPHQFTSVIPHGLKNAFLLEKKIKVAGPLSGTYLSKEMKASRVATIVYIGEGETLENIEAAAVENTLQIKENIRRLVGSTPANPSRLNYVSLVTNLPFLPGEAGLEARMENITKKVITGAPASDGWTGGDAHDVATIPTNIIGRVLNSPAIPGTSLFWKIIDFVRGLFSPAYRVQQGVESVLSAEKDTEGNSIISYFGCKSANDRTGTMNLLLTFEFIVKQLEESRTGPFLGNEQAPISVTEDEKAAILNKLVASGMDARLTDILSPGSSGLKGRSRQGNLFGKSRDPFIYRASADDNRGEAYFLASLSRGKTWMKRAAIITMLIATAIFIGLMSTLGWAQWSNPVMVLAQSIILFSTLAALSVVIIASAINYKKRDMLSASMITLVVMGIPLAILAVVNRVVWGNADYLFVIAWQGWNGLFASLPTLVLPISSLAIVGLLVIGFGYAVGRFVIGEKIGQWKAKRVCKKEWHELASSEENILRVEKNPVGDPDLELGAGTYGADSLRIAAARAALRPVVATLVVDGAGEGTSLLPKTTVTGLEDSTTLQRPPAAAPVTPRDVVSDGTSEYSEDLTDALPPAAELAQSLSTGSNESQAAAGKRTEPGRPLLAAADWPALAKSPATTPPPPEVAVTPSVSALRARFEGH